MRSGLSVGTLGALLLAAASARADASATAAPGGGLAAIGVRVDAAARTLRYRTCAAAPCSSEGPDAETVPIVLAAEQMPEASDIVVEALPIGQGRSIVHVRVPARGSPLLAWEALLAAPAAAGSPKLEALPVLFAGKTGFVEGQDGERSGPFVQILDGAAAKHVLLGRVREDLHVCGQATTILSPSGLDPSSLAFRGATVQRLAPEQRDGATRVIASAHGTPAGPAAPPLAPLLVALGTSSSEAGSFKALTDGDPSTSWSETRPGVGQGEFVTMSAPEEVPLTGFSVVVAPPLAPATAPAHGAPPKTPEAPAPRAAVAPQSFFLVTPKTTYKITLPEDGRMHPGGAYDFALPEPVRTSCLSLVLDDKAYDHGRPHPEVSLAELYAYSAFDVPGSDPGAQLEAAARALDGGGARADAAAGVLARAGAPGFAAMARAYDKLDAPGRALAIRVAASGSACDASAPLLVRAMSDTDREVRRKAEGKLENPLCGRAAVPALLQALEVEALRAKVAPLVASLAPAKALEPLARVLGSGPPSVRSATRSAFEVAAARGPKDVLVALVGDASRTPEARLDLVRASVAELGDARPVADGAIDDLLRASPSMPTRYLLVEPLVTLARAGDAKAVEHLTALLAHDPDPPVRARAAELAAGVAAEEPSLVGALRDPDPRVREAALRASSSAKIGRATPDALALLASDPWTFVRTAAAGVLATAPASADVDAKLGEALESDGSPRVRAATILALAERGATSSLAPIRARLDDAHEDADVRTAAAHALGALCDVRSLDRLTTFARAGADPLADEGASSISLAASESLGALHPADLARRLGPLLAKDARPMAQQAARASLAMPRRCR